MTILQPLNPSDACYVFTLNHLAKEDQDTPSRKAMRGRTGSPGEEADFLDGKVRWRRCTSACRRADRDLSFVTSCRICSKEGDRVWFGCNCLTIHEPVGVWCEVRGGAAGQGL